MLQIVFNKVMTSSPISRNRLSWLRPRSLHNGSPVAICSIFWFSFCIIKRHCLVYLIYSPRRRYRPFCRWSADKSLSLSQATQRQGRGALPGRSHSTQPNRWFDWYCCKVRNEVAFFLIERPYISKNLFTRCISPRGSP